MDGKNERKLSKIRRTSISSLLFIILISSIFTMVSNPNRLINAQGSSPSYTGDGNIKNHRTNNLASEDTNINAISGNNSNDTGPLFVGKGKSIKDLVSKPPISSTKPKGVPEPKEDPAVEKEREQKNLTPPKQRPPTLSFRNAPSQLAPRIDAASITTNVDGLSQLQAFIDGCTSSPLFPPDVQMDVGPNHVFEMVNDAGAIFTKQGAFVKCFKLHDFFQQPLDHFLFDPRVLYDAGRNVWYAVIDDKDCHDRNGNLIFCVHLSVIPSSDPVNTPPNLYDLPYSNCPDYPLMGYSDNVVAISANLFSSSKTNTCELSDPKQGAQYFLINKNDLINGIIPSSIRYYRSNPDLNIGIIYPVPSLSPSDTIYMASVADHSSEVKLLSFELNSAAAKALGAEPNNIASNKNKAITNSQDAAVTEISKGAVIEEWVDPDYGKKVTHDFLRGVTIYCTDTDQNCVNNINELGNRQNKLDAVGIYATPLKENPSNGYRDPVVQNCLANPNTAPNCYWGKATDIEYHPVEGRITATIPFQEPDSFISVDLKYDGTNLIGASTKQDCSPGGCIIVGASSVPLSFVKRQSASEVLVTTKVINDDGGNAKPTDFNVFLNNLVCQPGNTNCRPPIDKDQLQTVSVTGTNTLFLTYDASTSPPFQTVDYAVNIEAKKNPVNCHGEEGNTECTSYNGFFGYDISFSGDCSIKNAELDKQYNCVITLDDKPPIITETSVPIGEPVTAPSANQPGGAPPFEVSDVRILSAAWYQGRLWLAFDDRCFFNAPLPDRACIRLDQIDTASALPKLIQDFQVGQSDIDLFYPALSIDSSGNLIFVFGESTDRDANNNPVFPSLLLSGQAVNKPQTVDIQTVLVAGETPTDTTDPNDPNSRNRYGDYFAAGVDPSDKSRIWVAGEYHTNPDGPDWSTRIGQTVRVAGLSPQQVLIDSVKSLHTSGQVKMVLLNVLGNPTLPNGKINCGKLSAFLNVADAFKRAGKISPSQTALLIQQGQSVQNTIGCTAVRTASNLSPTPITISAFREQQSLSDKDSSSNSDYNNTHMAISLPY